MTRTVYFTKNNEVVETIKVEVNSDSDAYFARRSASKKAKEWYEKSKQTFKYNWIELGDFN